MPATEECCVLAQPALLGELLDILIDNACKNTARRGRPLSYLNRDAQAVRIEIQDQGCGISANDLPQLFTPFFRGRVPPARIEGTGLGLSIARRLVGGSLQGELTVDSQRGPRQPVCAEAARLSAVAARCPLAAADEGAGRISTAAYQREPLNRAMTRVLIIEDEQALRRNLQGRGLEEKGYPGHSRGIDRRGPICAGHDPDLILLDLVLPDGNGLDWLREFRTQKYRQPVLIVTAP